MTTIVKIVVPAPNHKRVRVQVINPEDNRVWQDVIVEHGEEKIFYVHSTSRLQIDEVD